jgi:hypothetical protein
VGDVKLARKGTFDKKKMNTVPAIEQKQTAYGHNEESSYALIEKFKNYLDSTLF